MPTVHPLPVNPTTGQQPLAALRGLGGGAVSSSAVNRDILKGLQDVAWSDDEDDPDCMVCAEPLDLSDQNFKPCQCGLQICQFCYHKLLRDDPRCPGCRRKYDPESVVYQPVDLEEVRRAKEKKAKRAKITKQLETMGRRHFLDTRIVMKNSVYVVGMKIPGSGSVEEATAILRSNEFFGQYGKISRLWLRERGSLHSPIPGPAPDSPATATGIYIVYVRREDAARAIAALDGIPSPQGPPGQVLHASYGATRYCEAFLRGVKCDHQNCPNLHEWGGDGDSFTRTDLITALTRPAEYDARQKQQAIQPPPITQKSAWPKPSSEDADSSNALPRTASWGMRPGPARPGSSTGGRIAPVGTSRPTSSKINSNLVPLGGGGRNANSSAFPPPAPSPAPAHGTKADKKKDKAHGMARGRSGSSSMGSAIANAASTAAASPKKKAVTAPITPVPAATPAKKSLSSTSTPAPPPGITPPPGLGGARSASTDTVPAPAPTKSPVKKTSAIVAETEPDEPEDEEEEEQPEAGPSRPASSPPKSPSTSYPIHSPYPDFDDVFTQPDARKQGFEFSLGLDDDELQRTLAVAHEMGGFEPSPFDPLFEQLTKLGIPLASLIAVPRGLEERGQVAYNGPFSPFAPSSPVETHSLPTSEEPSADTSASDDAEAPRTSSRFEFARRGSLASAGRGQSPFRSGRDEWSALAGGPASAAISAGGPGGGVGHRAPSSNGYYDDVPRHFHPALAHLNSGHGPASASSAGGEWGGNSGGGEYGFGRGGGYPGSSHGGGSAGPGGYFGSPQRERSAPGPMYSPAAQLHQQQHPGYDYLSHSHSHSHGNPALGAHGAHGPHGPHGPQSPSVYAGSGMGGYVQRRF